MPWLESPFAELNFARAELSPRLRNIATQIMQDGYAVIDTDIDHAVLDRVREGLAPLHPTHTSRVTGVEGPDRIQDAWRVDDGPTKRAVFNLACNPDILNVLRTLYRREPIPFQTLNFARGTEQRTHSDTIHFHSVPHRFMCAVWIALEDVDETSGPLHYYPGSHKLPVFEMSDLGVVSSRAVAIQQGSQRLYTEYERFIQSLCDGLQLKKRTFHAKKGQALIWSANLLHGGEPVSDSMRSRFSQVTHYFFEDCVYYKPLWSDIRAGHTIAINVRNLRNMECIEQHYNGYTLDLVDADASKTAAELFPMDPDKLPVPDLSTEASIRIMAWPRYEPEALERFADQYLRVIAGAEDSCACLRFDANHDGDYASAMQMLASACEKTLGSDASIEILIVNDDFDEVKLRRLGRQLTCTLPVEGGDSIRQEFIRTFPVHQVESAEELANILAILH